MKSQKATMQLNEAFRGQTAPMRSNGPAVQALYSQIAESLQRTGWDQFIIELTKGESMD